VNFGEYPSWLEAYQSRTRRPLFRKEDEQLTCGVDERARRLVEIFSCLDFCINDPFLSKVTNFG